MSAVLRAELERVAARLGTPDASFALERPRDNDHGDLATNLALVLAKPLRQNPRAASRSNSQQCTNRACTLYSPVYDDRPIYPQMQRQSCQTRSRVSAASSRAAALAASASMRR